MTHRLPYRLTATPLLLLLLATSCVAAAASQETPAPRATSAVQQLLDGADGLLKEKKASEALASLSEALVIARSAGDKAGEGLAHRARARALEASGQRAEAATAWQEAAAAWTRAGDGPGEVEALCAAALVLIRDRPEEGASRLGRAAALARHEVRRPLAAIAILNDASDKLVKIARPGEARLLSEAALELGQIHAPGSLAVATSLDSLGTVAGRQGDLVAARDYLLRSLEIREKHAPGSLEVASSLNGLGSVALNRGELGDARGYFLRSLEIREKHAPGALEVAGSLSNLGLVADEQGDLVAALDYHLRALEIRERQAPGSPDVARSLNSLGNVAISQGDLEAAREYYQRALVIDEKHDPGSLDVAVRLNNLANVAREQGELVAALDYNLRALRIKEKHAPGSLSVAKTFNNLGAVASDRGDLVAARDYHQRALEIREKHAPGSLEVALSLNNLGNVAARQGDLAAARDYFLRALEIREKHAPGSIAVAMSLDNLGNVALDQGDPAAAREHHFRALQIIEKHAPGSIEVARSFKNLGSVAREQRDLVAARDYQLRSLHLFEKHAPGSLELSLSLNNLGDVAVMQGDLVAARDYHLRALEIQERQAPRSLAVADTLLGLGELALEGGKPADAVRDLERSWEIVRGQGAAVAGDVARQAFAQRYSSYATKLATVQLRLGRTAEALQSLEEGRAQALLQMLAERGLGERLTEPGLWRAYLDAESALQRAGKRLAEAGAEEARVESSVRSLEAAAVASEGELAAKREDLGAARAAREHALSAYTQARLEAEKQLAMVRQGVPGLETEPAALERGRRGLPAGSVFLVFAVGEDSTLSFIIPAGTDEPVQAHTLPVGEKELARQVASLRESIEEDAVARGIGGLSSTVAGEKSGPVDVVAHELFASLFPKETRTALDKAKRIVLSPDGPLLELPFAALVIEPSEGGPRRLGLMKPLSYAPSLTVFALDRKPPSGSASSIDVLAVGDPLYARPAASSEEKAADTAGAGGPKAPGTAAAQAMLRGERSLLSRDGLPPLQLPWARREAEGVARLYGTQPLLGEAATEAAVRARLPRASVIHLATHGYFHPRLAMSSGILLTPPRGAGGGTADDGALQAWEFGPLLPLSANLVVLSACETARGQKVRGEGLVGLTRSLLAAGARSVVATHWKVADNASADLMLSFHENLRSGIAKDEALRRAMEVVQSREATSYPFLWAGFFLTGDPDDLFNTKGGD